MTKDREKSEMIVKGNEVQQKSLKTKDGQNPLVLDAAQALAAMTGSSQSGSKSPSMEKNSSNQTTLKHDEQSRVEVAKMKTEEVLSAARKSSKGKAVRFPVKVCS